MVDTREAITDTDRHAIFRLRYDIYVLERGCPQAYADHERRIIADPLDPPPGQPSSACSGCLLGAFDDAGVCHGTVRYTPFSQPIAEYAKWYRLDELGLAGSPRAGMVTKFAVAPAYRKGVLPLRLMRAIYKWGLGNGCDYALIDCNAPLRPLFEAMGFRQVIPDFVHPEYGLVHPMVLVMHDLDHLRSIRSPFVPVLEGLAERDLDSVASFNSRFPHTMSTS